MLNISHLTKCYGDKKAVDDLSLHIAPGEIYGFIGHNGAGKTTTLKSVVGILRFDSGEITINGHSIQSEPLECKKALAYIPDNPDLYEYMTGIQYLSFLADVFAVSAQERQKRIEKYAAMFELTDDLGQPIASYSHGMKQKLAIIAAWIHDPQAHHYGRTLCGPRPQGVPSAEGHDAGDLRPRRRDLLLHPRVGGCRKALRQSCHHQGRQADPLRHHGGGQG